MVAGVVRGDFTDDWEFPGPRSPLSCLEIIEQEGLGLDGHRECRRITCTLDICTARQEWGLARADDKKGKREGG